MYFLNKKTFNIFCAFWKRLVNFLVPLFQTLETLLEGLFLRMGPILVNIKLNCVNLVDDMHNNLVNLVWHENQHWFLFNSRAFVKSSYCIDCWLFDTFHKMYKLDHHWNWWLQDIRVVGFRSLWIIIQIDQRNPKWIKWTNEFKVILFKNFFLDHSFGILKLMFL
jgi:hypothetical protein